MPAPFPTPPVPGWLRLAAVLALAGPHAGAQVLPPPPPPASDALGAAPAVFVREFTFEGNHTFPSTELAAVVAPWTGRRLATEDLEEARQALTRYYVDRGYLNSGAVLDDQPADTGVIRFRLVEGQLTSVEVDGNRWLSTGHLRRRVAGAPGTPLNVEALREKLLLLRDDPGIRRLNAELSPGTDRGEADLRLHVDENSPFHAGLQLRNDRPPSVGAEVLELLLSDTSLTGHSDALEFRYGIAQRSPDGVEASGLDNLGASYVVPVSSRDTTLGVSYTRCDYGVIEEPFASLGIESASENYGVRLRHPLLRTTREELGLSLGLDHSRSHSTLDGEPFSFSPGSVDGRTTQSAVRLAADFITRTANHVLALRLGFGVGVDVLDMTDDGSDRDGLFTSWTGQAQYVSRIGDTANRWIASTTFQWSPDPLLSFEQFPIGGAHTVRGYRENQLVRDYGVLASLEFRLPVLTGAHGDSLLELAPFFDFGAGWDNGPELPVATESSPRDHLASAGVGLILTPVRSVAAVLYWGYGFTRFEEPAETDAQDLGLHFRLQVSAF